MLVLRSISVNFASNTIIYHLENILKWFCTYSATGARFFLIIIIAWEHTGVETEGGRSCEVSRELLSDPMGRCEVSSVPASTHPLLTSICRGTCRTTGFVWGVGVMTERSHTHTVPPPRNGEQQIFLLWGETFSTCWPVQEKPLFLQWTTFRCKEILCFYTNMDIQKKSSQWNNKCRSCEKIEMYTWSLLTETVGCIKLLWTPVMRKLWLVLPLGVEKDPCHCAFGTVFSFLGPSAGHLPYCITDKQYLYQFWFFFF